METFIQAIIEKGSLDKTLDLPEYTYSDVIDYIHSSEREFPKNLIKDFQSLSDEQIKNEILCTTRDNVKNCLALICLCKALNISILYLL